MPSLRALAFAFACACACIGAGAASTQTQAQPPLPPTRERVAARSAVRSAARGQLHPHARHARIELAVRAIVEVLADLARPDVATPRAGTASASEPPSAHEGVATAIGRYAAYVAWLPVAALVNVVRLARHGVGVLVSDVVMPIVDACLGGVFGVLRQGLKSVYRDGGGVVWGYRLGWGGLPLDDICSQLTHSAHTAWRGPNGPSEACEAEFDRAFVRFYVSSVTTVVGLLALAVGFIALSALMRWTVVDRPRQLYGSHHHYDLHAATARSAHDQAVAPPMYGYPYAPATAAPPPPPPSAAAPTSEVNIALARLAAAVGVSSGGGTRDAESYRRMQDAEVRAAAAAAESRRLHRRLTRRS